jgi:DNA-binding MarR family transcriptional regulator
MNNNPYFQLMILAELFAESANEMGCKPYEVLIPASHVAKRLSISPYKAKKLLKDTCEMGLTRRVKNQYSWRVENSLLMALADNVRGY